MQVRKSISLKIYKLVYHTYRVKTRVSKVCVSNGGYMDETEYQKCLDIINQFKK